MPLIWPFVSERRRKAKARAKEQAMKAILLLFDSLTLKSLARYGGPHPTPNFERLAAHSVVFDRHKVGSLPCMPARRDLQTVG